MSRSRSPLFAVLLLGLLAACQKPIGAHRTVSTPGDFDAAQQAPVVKSAPTVTQATKGAVAHEDVRLGVPTFVWATRDGSERAPAGATAEDAARAHLTNYAADFRLSAQGAASAKLARVHDTGAGPVIADFKQEIDGVEVFRQSLHVLMDQNLNAVALSGNLSPNAEGATAAKLPFKLAPEEAIAFALSDLSGELLAAGSLNEPAAAAGKYRYFTLTPDAGATYKLSRPARAQKVYYNLPAALEPAYYVEIEIAREGQGGAYYSYVVSANNGQLLFRKDLSAAAEFSYYVWADPDGHPLDGPTGRGGPFPIDQNPVTFSRPFVAPSLIKISNYPFSKNDPWLGPRASNTYGNNVFAYADLEEPNGFGPDDVLPSLVAPGSFARAFDPNQAPDGSLDQTMAATTSMFYAVNFFHDWYYDAGFDEASGNAQVSNYGRGGLEADPVLAEAQDYSGRNNANMSTPADGASPRMQMYIFNALTPTTVVVDSPSEIAGPLTAAAGAFGPVNYALSSELVLVDDGGGAGTASDGCEAPFVNAAAVSGKIALIDRGTCSFAPKALNAQQAGAIAVVVINNVAGAPISMSGGTDPSAITIPGVMITLAAGNTIKAKLGEGAAVMLSMSHAAGVDRDGTVDNMIIAHEWGHYISNRLIGNAAGLTGNHQRGLGEGWADFHSLLLTVRAADTAVTGNAKFRGAYPMGTYVTSGVGVNNEYFGIRRVPYSVDFGIDPLTFKHIQKGVALPGYAPIKSGADGSNNNEVHATGEVWATMLWECYAALLEETQGAHPSLSFDEARERMKRYIVAAYKITPMSPTLLEARDALRAVALAEDPADFLTFSAAFARRGAGLRAVAPDRNSSDNLGVVESFAVGNDIEVASVDVSPEIASACAPDGVLDNGDTVTLTVKVRNTGTGLLSAASAVVTTTNPAVTISDGGFIRFKTMEPFATATGSVKVTLSGATGVTRVDFTIAATDPTLAIPGTVTKTLAVRANYDVAPASSTVDDVESPTLSWTLSHDPTLAAADWQRVELAPLSHAFVGSDMGAPSDMSIISPTLNVAAGTDLVVSFKHAYDFETAVDTRAYYYDGGVIEVSTDGGTTWADAGAAAGYPVTLEAGGLNPLQGRPAFGGRSAGFPMLAPASVNFGGAYAGQSIKLRFRVGSDENSGGAGWIIDDIAVSGISNTPFGSLVADPGCSAALSSR